MTDISESFDEGVASNATADAADTTSTSAPPISEILSSSRDESTTADVPARPAPGEDREERTRIPLAALRRERERRERMDAQVAELELELQRYNDQKWGFNSEDGNLQNEADGTAPAPDPIADRYQKAYTAFAAKQGPEKLAEFNHALNQLTPSQIGEINALVRETGDPQTAVEYLDNAGLLNRAQSIKDVLAGAKPHDPAANAEANKLQEHVRSLEAREQQLAHAERVHVERGSQASFAQHHGHETLMSVDAVVGAMLERNHPLVPHLQQIYQSSPDPTTAVAVALHDWGMWSPQAAQPQRPAPVFPSNLAGARNVGSRSGPAWSGPPSLDDIFDRSQPNGG